MLHNSENETKTGKKKQNENREKMEEDVLWKINHIFWKLISYSIHYNIIWCEWNGTIYVCEWYWDSMFATIFHLEVFY